MYGVTMKMNYPKAFTTLFPLDLENKFCHEKPQTLIKIFSLLDIFRHRFSAIYARHRATKPYVVSGQLSVRVARFEITSEYTFLLAVRMNTVYTLM
jgi:hypothetical protein